MSEDVVKVGAGAVGNDEQARNAPAAPGDTGLPQPVPLPGMEAVLNPLDEAQLRSAEARRVFETSDHADAWLDAYWALMAEGWSWRQACYMIWASQPQPRTPKTQWELATEVLGLTSDRAIREWRAQIPGFEARIMKLTASALLQHVPGAIEALGTAAGDHSYKGNRDRKLLFEMAGLYTQHHAIEFTAPDSVDKVREADTETLRAMVGQRVVQDAAE